jgi:outer membrane protein, multidrug efflux system
MNKIDKKQKTTLLILCGFTLLLNGCMVGPNYHRPDINTPSSWAGQTGPQAAASQDARLIKWWADFNDSSFVSLIERAMKSNLDIKLAQERILQARASRGVVSAGLWPTVDATADYTRSRTPAPIGQRARISNQFQTGWDAAWELDFFGGTRRNIEASDADIQAAIEDRRDVLVTLTAEVAVNYAELRGFQQRIIIAQDNLKAQQHSEGIVRQRFEGGFVSALDLANAEAQVATTLSQIPVFETSAQQSIYTIAVLLGQEPQSLLSELSPSAPIPMTPPEIPAGLPSEILRRRPDIRRTEAQIHAATARIGVATADLFPKFNLTGSVGYRNSDPGALQQRDNFWSVGPSVDWQIFNMGRVGANIDVQKALQRQSMLSYKKTILTALQDVENALIAYSKEKQHQQFLMDAVAANQKAVNLATQLYTEGQTDFLSVLDAQRSLFASEDALVQSTQNLVTDLIGLYKALGGGWDNESSNAIQDGNEPNSTIKPH